MTTTVPELSVEEITDLPENRARETEKDYRLPDNGTPEVAEIKLDKGSIDPKKPLVPDDSRLGTGCTYYAYPMNSIMLSVYQAPSQEAKRIGRVLSGGEVTLLATVYFGYSDSWSYIICGEIKGWCRSRDMTATRFEWLDLEGLQLPEKCYDHADYSGGICDVLTDGTELCTAPDNGSEVRGHIKKGCTLRAFGDTPSAKGWLFAAVSAEYLEEGGTGEVYGWVYTDGGRAVREAATRN